MSDWDFLHEMNNSGDYTKEEIADAAACGYNPSEVILDLEDDLVISPKSDKPEKS